MKLFVTCSFLCVIGIISCNINSNSDNTSSAEIIPKPINHLLKKTYYPSGKIAAVIAYNAHSLKDSISDYYNESGNIDSTIQYVNGKLDGITNNYYDDRTEVRLYKNDSLICLSIYDPQNVLEYKVPLDTNLIKKPRFRFVSGRTYFDKNKIDTLILVTEGVPMANRVISISGATMLHLNDTSYIIRSPKKQNSDSVIIHIGIGYGVYDSTDTTDNNMIYQSIRFLKK